MVKCKQFNSFNLDFLYGSRLVALSYLRHQLKMRT
uniref:Uncharacterized protein n=1 Tax=Rhizophora mucronata TaxID=61149 RepID=A0A2P2Q159_RHIMU